MIRLAQPDIEDEDVDAVAAVLRTGCLVQGIRVAEFERGVAARAAAAHGVAVANCTSALHLALLALGVGAGDAVAVAAFSWPATANVVALAGAEPAFVDIDPRTWNMDPAALHRVLSQRDNVKAILPVHVFGGMANMPEIAAIARLKGVPLVEDAACALGAVLAGHPAGGWGRIGCFSFHPRKNITTGEGGMIVTDDAAIARRCRILRNHGLDPDASDVDFVAAGYNLRLTEFQGALGLIQLRKLDRILEQRQTLAAWYGEALAGAGLTLPAALEPGAHVYQSYVVLLPAGIANARGSIISALRALGVEASIGTHHQPLTRYFRQRGGYAPGDFPVTDSVSARALALPFHTFMQRADVLTVAERLVAALGTAG